jgi:hypothetical protein
VRSRKIVVLSTLFAAALLASAADADRERTMQGNGAFSKFKADVDERLTFNNDFQGILYRYDFNRDVPVGDTICQAYQIVPKGQSEHLKKAAGTGFLATQEQTYQLPDLSVRYTRLDLDAVYPGLTNALPQLNFYDYWNLRRPIVWNQTADGIPFSTIYAQTQGQDVIYNLGIFNKGQVQQGNWVINMCGTYSWDHTSLWEAEADLVRRALGVLLLELSAEPPPPAR